MVHSSEVLDDEGYVHRGSKVIQVDVDAEPPEWRLRDFGFAAYGSGEPGRGLKEIHFGRRSIWAFASAREHCEEIVIFRRGTDTRRKWDEDALKEPNVGQDMFFLMRMRQLTADTPLNQQFNGEWGFWESFFVPLLDEQQTPKLLRLLDPATCEDYFAALRAPVTCHHCPEGSAVLTVPDDLVVRYEVKAVCKDLDTWSDLCNKIGEDMAMQDVCIVEHKHLKPGDECIGAYHEMTGSQHHARLVKRDFEQLKLPVVLTFLCELRPATEWSPDLISLQYKFDALATVYNSNLLGGYSSLSGARADPWNPMARLAVNALGKVLARFPDIRVILDAGCGDMAWMSYFLADYPSVSYIGVDMMPWCLAANFRRFPTMQFIQTDLSNLSGVEVLPQGCDLVIAKDLFNHMVLPDAVNALKRLVMTRPRFILTHVHGASDNTGWEKRIDKHLHYTRYDYNKPPFSLPYPAVEIQRISDEAYFVLYEVTLEGVAAAPQRIEHLRIPVLDDIESFALVADGELIEQATVASSPVAGDAAKADELGPRPTPHRETGLAAPVTSLPPQDEAFSKPTPERKPIKGIPAVEFHARCDTIFEKFDRDKDNLLAFEELAALMEAGGRIIEEYNAYASLCQKLGCDPRQGLTRKDVYKLFDKAPQVVWEEVYRSINPLAQMVKKGTERLPETFLERPIPSFIFEDEDLFAKVCIEVNSHLYYGAAEVITMEHVQALFGKQRLEVRVVAPGSYGAKDVYLWRLVITPLTAEVVPEDCHLELKDTTGRFGSKKLVVKLMKSKKKKWYKAGHTETGLRV